MLFLIVLAFSQISYRECHVCQTWVKREVYTVRLKESVFLLVIPNFRFIIILRIKDQIGIEVEKS